MRTVIALPRHKLTVTEYHHIVMTGILTDEDRLEFIEGGLIEMAAYRAGTCGCCRARRQDIENPVHVVGPRGKTGYLAGTLGTGT